MQNGWEEGYAFSNHKQKETHKRRERGMSEKKSQSPVLVLIMVWLTWGFIAMDRVLPIFSAPALVPDIGMTNEQFGWLMSGLTITWAVFAFFGGHFSDRVGRVKVIVPAAIWFSVFTALTATGKSFGSLLLIRVLLGVGEGAFWGAGVALLAESWAEEKRGLAMGFNQTGFPVFFFIAAVFGGYMTQNVGWRYPFVVAGIAGIILALLFWWLVRDPMSLEERRAGLREGAERKEGIGTLFKNRDYVFNLAAMAVTMVGYWSITSFLGLYMTKVKGFEIGSGAAIAGISGIIGACGMFFSGWISDRIGRKKAVFFSCAIAILGTILLIASKATAMLVISYILLGWGIFALYPMLLAIVPIDVAPLSLMGTAAGITMFVSEVFGIIGPVLGGRLSDLYGLAYPLYLGIIAYAVTFILYVFMRETAPKFRKA
jgi:predicted MFS family arabinose efflux permease